MLAQVRLLRLHFWIALALTIPIVFSTFILPYIPVAHKALMQPTFRGSSWMSDLGLVLLCFSASRHVPHRVHPRYSASNVDRLADLSIRMEYSLEIAPSEHGHSHCTEHYLGLLVFSWHHHCGDIP